MLSYQVFLDCQLWDTGLQWDCLHFVVYYLNNETRESSNTMRLRRIERILLLAFTSLNQAERAVVMFGDEAYRKSLDLDNDDAPCWKIPSGESTTFVGWNPMCVPYHGIHCMETKTP